MAHISEILTESDYYQADSGQFPSVEIYRSPDNRKSLVVQDGKALYDEGGAPQALEITDPQQIDNLIESITGTPSPILHVSAKIV